MTTETGKKTQQEWLSKFPDLKRVGSELKGPCPNCGGKDRFWVRRDGVFGCRQCDDFTAIMAAAWPGETSDRSDAPAPKPKTWTYTGTKGSQFTVHRQDGPNGKKVWQSPSGVTLQSGEKWQPYLHNKDDNSRPLLFVEGEKCGAYAALHCRDACTVATIQRSIADNDFSIVRDRDVVCWPDNDRAGYAKLRDLLSALRKAGAKSLSTCRPQSGYGQDCADLPPDALRAALEKTWPVGGGPLDSCPIISISPQGLATALKFAAIDVRYNLRSTMVETCPTNSKPAIDIEPDWADLTDRAEAELAEFIRQNFATIKTRRERGMPVTELAPATFGCDRWTSCLNAMLNRREIDPFRKWLEQLPPWDGTVRARWWLGELFEVTDPDGTEAWASLFPLLGAVWRCFQPGTKMDELPVFVGPQGIGKSTALAQLLPPELSNMFGDGLVLSADPQKRIEATLGKIIVEVAEMRGSTRAEVADLRSFLSRQDDGGIRLSYDRRPERRLRRFVMVGTTNDPECLPADPAGNRRFCVVNLGDQLKSFDGLRRYFAENREQLWAEALYLYRQGETAHLPDALKPAQAARNENHRSRDQILEDALDEYLAGQRFGQTAKPKNFTMREVLLECGYTKLEDQLAQKRMAAALRLRGYEKARVQVAGKQTIRWTLTTKG